VHDRLLFAPELLAQDRPLARRQRESRLGDEDRGFGLLDAPGERGGFTRGALRRVTRVFGRALEQRAARFGGAAFGERYAQCGAGLCSLA
jgi:hypothetical protein